MVKFFMQHYDIPTKKDFAKLSAKMDRLEKLIKAAKPTGSRTRVSNGTAAGRGTARSKSGATAYDRVLGVIKGHKQGAGFSEIRDGTGFDEKKIRNIIFRLNKIGKIRRKRRGLYIAK